jgi:hypothetical protein
MLTALLPLALAADVSPRPTGSEMNRQEVELVLTTTVGADSVPTAREQPDMALEGGVVAFRKGASVGLLATWNQPLDERAYPILPEWTSSMGALRVGPVVRSTDQGFGVRGSLTLDAGATAVLGVPFALAGLATSLFSKDLSSELLDVAVRVVGMTSRASLHARYDGDRWGVGLGAIAQPPASRDAAFLDVVHPSATVSIRL